MIYFETKLARTLKTLTSNNLFIEGEYNQEAFTKIKNMIPDSMNRTDAIELLLLVINDKEIVGKLYDPFFKGYRVDKMSEKEWLKFTFEENRLTAMRLYKNAKKIKEFIAPIINEDKIEEMIREFLRFIIKGGKTNGEEKELLALAKKVKLSPEAAIEILENVEKIVDLKGWTTEDIKMLIGQERKTYVSNLRSYGALKIKKVFSAENTPTIQITLKPKQKHK